jgi:hypothetical protein
MSLRNCAGRARDKSYTDADPDLWVQHLMEKLRPIGLLVHRAVPALSLNLASAEERGVPGHWQQSEVVKLLSDMDHADSGQGE